MVPFFDHLADLYLSSNWCKLLWDLLPALCFLVLCSSLGLFTGIFVKLSLLKLLIIDMT